ncbi:MAG TPA: HAD-IA family hydrolase, partial [Acholeplasma sp.]|nr:HAD-IA family hydrolase [Acholeplasma sp.]
IEIIYDNIRKTFAKFLPDKKFSEDELKQFVGPTLHHSFAWYQPDPKIIEEMVEYYRKINLENHEKGVKAYPHAKEVLMALKEHGYAIGIVSSKLRNVVEMGLKQNDMLQYVDVVIGSDDVTKHKPDREPIIKCLKALSVGSANATYVGDHAWDIEAAKASGVKSVGVAYSIHYDKLVASKPDVIVDDLEKLLYIL